MGYAFKADDSRSEVRTFTNIEGIVSTIKMAKTRSGKKIHLGFFDEGDSWARPWCGSGRQTMIFPIANDNATNRERYADHLCEKCFRQRDPE